MCLQVQQLPAAKDLGSGVHLLLIGSHVGPLFIPTPFQPLVRNLFCLEVRTPPYPKAESLSSLCALILYHWLYTHALRHNTFHGFSDTATAYKGLALLLALVHVGR